jgi:hypothetical protein
MECEFCGGVVEWQGPLSNLTHTKCTRCGATNCQIVNKNEENEEQNETLNN